MEITENYPGVRFSEDVLNKAINATIEVARKNKIDLDSKRLKVQIDDSMMEYDSMQEFLRAYRKCIGGAIFDLSGYSVGLLVRVINANTPGLYTTIEVQAPLLSDAELIFDVFEKHSPNLSHE